MDEKQLSIDIVGLLGACSDALDCIEAELVNISNKHGKRVAYMSVCMAKYWNVESDALQDLAICALLHDNALTQYIAEEVQKNHGIDVSDETLNEKTNLHCIYGENNIAKIPFKTNVSNVILYIMSMLMEEVHLKKFGKRHLCLRGLFILQMLWTLLQAVGNLNRKNGIYVVNFL